MEAYMGFLTSISSFSSMPAMQDALVVASSKRTMFPHEVSSINPQLGQVVETSSQSVGTLFASDGRHIGCGLLVGIDRFLVPAHVIGGTHPSDLMVNFGLNSPIGQESFPQKFKVIQFAEVDLNFDFCILQLDLGEDGRYPGEQIPIPKFSQEASDVESFFLIHANEKGTKVVSFGEPCPCSSKAEDFCSINDTSEGSSGGINFDFTGNPFAMHYARSSGLYGSSLERKAIFLRDIFARSRILSSVPLDVTLPLPIGNVQGVPIIESFDLGIILEKHGTLKITVKSREAIRSLTKHVFEEIIDFLKEFKSTTRKLELYSNLSGQHGTIYEIPEEGYPKLARMDRQAHPADAADIQIQVEDKTIATLLISNSLLAYPRTSSKIAEVVNYVVLNLMREIYHARKREEAVVLRMDPLD